MYRTIRQSSVLLLTATLLLSGITPIGMAAPSADQFHPLSDSGNVTIWERAILPLRTDTTNAATVVPNLHLFVNVPDANTGEVPANKNSLAVYNKNTTLTLRFQSRLGVNTTSFAHEDVQLLVAKVNTSAAIESEDNLSGLPIELGMRLLAPQNEIATYEFLNGTTVDTDGDGKFDSNGEVTLSYDFAHTMNHGADRGAGQYVFFLVQNSQSGGFTVSEDGNLSVTGDAQVLGVDNALVQQEPATVTTPNTEYDAGDSMQFSADANIHTDGPTNHAVIVYKQEGTATDGFINQKAVIVFNETPSRNLSAENITLQRSIHRVHGVARADGNVSLVGRNLTDGRISDGVGMLSFVEWISEKSGVTMPAQETIEPNDSLPASATAVRTQTGTADLTVETLANWSAGTYRYIYVASTDNDSRMSTQTGVLSVRSADADSGDTDSGSSSGGASNDGSSGSGARGGSSGGDASTGDESPATGGAGSSADPDIVDKVEGEIDASTGQLSIRFNRSQTLSAATIQFTDGAAGSVRFEELSGLPSNVPSAIQDGKSVVSQFHIYVPSGLRNQSASVQFTLAASAVTTDPSTLTVLHYNETAIEWETLETTIVSQENGTITIEAATPGFSLFAITQGSAQQETPEGPRTTPDEPQTTPQDDGQQDDLQGTPVGAENDDSVGGLLSSFISIFALLMIVILAIIGVAVYRQRQ